MNNDPKSYYKDDARVAQVVDYLNDNKNVFCKGLIGSARAYVTAAAAEKLGGQHFVVCPDKEHAAYFYNDLENIYGERETDYAKKMILFYPTSYKRPYEPEKADNTYILSRTEVLQRISTSERKTIVVSYPEALCEKIVTRKIMNKNTFKISVGEKIDMDCITDTLLEYNFEHVDFVVEPGQFAIRGAIVDVFSFANDYPYRIVFDFDEVESIRSFNPIDQLSIEKLNRIVLLPNLQGHKLSDDRETILQYLNNQTVVWLEETDYLKERIDIEYDKAVTVFDKLEEQEDLAEPEDIFAQSDEILTQLDDLKTVAFDTFSDPTGREEVVFNTIAQPVFNKNFDMLLDSINVLKDKGFRILFFSESSRQLERIQSILNDLQKRGNDVDCLANDFEPVLYAINSGFVDNDLKLCCYTDHQVFERYHRFHIREGFAANQALTIKELYDLKPGDYVTHIDHGIGRFTGLVILNNQGKQSESMRLEYQGGDLLYVSIHSLHRIAKYSSKDGAEPTLGKLGSNAWNKLKTKTKSKVKDIARELIKLYAERKKSVGFQFSPDTYLQTELEASFMYEDTPDQLKATVDVKRDMEKESPMDRLVCGDVGFGKTEVAMRAAFKAVCDGKQVAVLVPTTVLATQHYHTFLNRLRGFPVTIDYMNRFKTPQELKMTIEEVKSGRVDILIGTHRILSKDVVFKDLGLLIIDEEQKFGVSAKERLKQLKTNVDTLTLTATPIPRTLQFSMMGARDMSVINTPPPNRYPVETELRSFSPEVVRDAIQFELARDGQVFFVHNRVQNILDVRDLIQTWVPFAKITVAHGQMDGDELEAIMLDFIDGKYDVLLCTTIIEAGLDIANVNTIIINDAHKFGLSDLHQLRGRVGRSNRKAFCYLLTPPLPSLSDEAQKRLRALEQYSDLGSGFSIATRDLDIRGAGNLLGAEQSGFINDIGFETYHKILDEAIAELKETEFKDVFDTPDAKIVYVKECQIESDLEILLPVEYVDSSTERMSLYNELDHIETEENLTRFTDKLIDRFGPVPPQTNDLLNTVRLRWLARDLGFEKIVLKHNDLTCYFLEDKNSSYFDTEIFQKIIEYASTHLKRCKFIEQNNKNILIIKAIDRVKDALVLLKEITG